MTDFGYAEILQKMFERYFSDKTINGTDIIQKIVNTIFQTIDCDLEKLIYSLEQLCNLKQNNMAMNFQQTENEFDVSLNSNVYVKGFLSNDKPLLYFYKNNEHLPFFKIKSYDNLGKKRIVVEATNDSSVFKSKTIMNPEFLCDNSFVIRDDYVCENTDVFTHSTVLTKTGRSDGLENKELAMLNDEEKNFYNFIRNNFIKNGVFLPNDLTQYESEVLIGYFYNTLNSVVSYDNEFDIKDLIYIMNSFIIRDSSQVLNFNENNGLSVAAKYINNEILKNKFIDDKFEIKTYGKTGCPLTIKVSMVSEYISIDITDDVNMENVCNYIACKTNEGFFLFRNVKDPKFLKENEKNSAFTINLSENEIKFTIIGNSGRIGKLRNPVDLGIKFNENNNFILNVDQISYEEFGGTPLNNESKKISML